MIDSIKVGNTISILRKRQKLTQKDLARKLNVSDKAVSKWERGIGLPDISILSVLSMALDTDVNSLLEGDYSNRKENWIGLLDIQNPSIKYNVKVHDKPLIFYIISYFMLAGINEIYIICSDTDKKTIIKLLKNIHINVHYINNKKELPKSNVMLINDLFFIYCQNLTRTFNKAMSVKDGISIVSLPSNGRKKGSRYIKYDSNNRIVFNDKDSIETMYNHEIIPICFIPIKLFAIVQNINNNILELKDMCTLYTIPMFRGVIYIPFEDVDDINDVSNIVKIVQKRDFDIGNIEEIQRIRGYE